MSNNSNESDSQNSKSSQFDSMFNSNLLSTWIDDAQNQVSSLLNDFTNDRRYLDILDRAAGFRSIGDILGASSLPTLRQYDECKSQQGKSVWTEDGVWRCLFKGQQPPEHLKHQFTDYTGFLDYQRDLLQKKRAEDAANRQQLQLQQKQQQQQQQQQQPTPFGDWGVTPTDKFSFPGSANPRLISEQEAKGKKIISQSQSTESVSMDDGTIRTRTHLVKHFDDGTALIKRSEDSSDSGSWGSWFWK